MRNEATVLGARRARRLWAEGRKRWAALGIKAIKINTQEGLEHGS